MILLHNLKRFTGLIRPKFSRISFRIPIIMGIFFCLILPAYGNPLHEACKNNDIEKARAILSKPENSDLISAPDVHGKSALYYAID